MVDKPTAVIGPQQVSRYATLWRRLFSIKGATPEPIPVLNLDNSYDALELAAIRGEQPAWGSADKAAVVGQNSFVSLQNSFGDVIARVEQVVILSTVAGRARIGYSTFVAGSVNSATCGPRDNRFPNGNNSQGCSVWTGSGTMPGGLGLTLPLVAGVPLWLPWASVLVGGPASPGLFVYHETANTDIFAAFLFRVRRLEPSEQTVASA